ncbi:MULTISPECIES: glycosyltransferase family 2 protein [unclassified Mycobacterium]|uniref:glycosyltransferase family 2 protein n=1 Tax=unclassified Mycobacterium TaxID=2642494 RepID=UPI0007FB8A80|nr:MULTISPECIES: glycosyltransferase family 2 protein [unclassified Mycobacterium]OBG70642.1 glycosyltransferase [Mycobacterium sp. E1214]OBH29429.1 glycosyltransferase [Mycobacterium sp. E1319]
MTSPTFSIVIPTFNVASTLPACFDSVLAQTCTDFEIVMIDGESTDDTFDIAGSYSAKFGDRLVTYRGRDEGAYDAMNRGVGMASGRWLLFLGADDALYEPATLARVNAFLAEHDSSELVYGDVMMRSTGKRYGGEFDLDRLLYETNICHQAIFYRRKLFDGIGPYNLRYRLWADWDFNIRCFSNPALVTKYMDIVVANYNDMSGLSIREDEEFKKRLPHSTKFVLRVPLTSRRTLDVRWGRPYAGDPRDASRR